MLDIAAFRLQPELAPVIQPVEKIHMEHLLLQEIFLPRIAMDFYQSMKPNSWTSPTELEMVQPYPEELHTITSVEGELPPSCFDDAFLRHNSTHCSIGLKERSSVRSPVQDV
ncbi:hypothetical protein CK203_055009 [Vitis vinifera]|uniref:Uncharacterized protein n=1 Tax=Vitis vinifera TaxID=29760 RepID=A0A438GNE8_VITVI|nr:hypothetical protein CK203_055009 [Vitis vinifera]